MLLQCFGLQYWNLGIVDVHCIVHSAAVLSGAVERTNQRIYISVIEWTAPPCVFQTFAHPTSTCSVCSILQLPDCLTELAGGEVGWAKFWKTQGGAVPSITDIYSLTELGRRERFRVFASPTQKHIDDAKREDASLLKTTQSRKMRQVTDAKLRVTCVSDIS